MKNALLRTPFSAVALALGMLAAAPSFAADTKSVAVTAIVEHPALDAVRDGVKAELKAAGYEEGKNLKFAYQSAQGNVGTAAQIARKYVGDAPDGDRRHRHAVGAGRGGRHQDDSGGVFGASPTRWPPSW